MESTAATYGRVDHFNFAGRNPIEARDCIIAQAEKHAEHNIVIAPMSTKLSTIGVGLAAFTRVEYQICYAEAAQYNYLHYSVPSDRCYLLDLPELFSA